MSGAYLILENGVVFKGRSFGYDAQAVGELVFSTAMTGYLETLADPVYYGQIVLQTFPLIGNYGVIPSDFGSGPVHLKAYIVREWCQEPSNFRNEGDLDSFLRKWRVPGLFGIDTRALTRILRENGVMNAMVSKTPELSADQWAALRGYRITGAVAAVCEGGGAGSLERGAVAAVCEGGGAGSLKRDAGSIERGVGLLERESGLLGQGAGSLKQGAGSLKRGAGLLERGAGARVVIWDFGGAARLVGQFEACGISPVIAGHDTAANDICAAKPDGVVLSGGPGDPVENTHIIEEIGKLCGSGIPILGVGLGHQMLAHARGAGILKLPFGHRGANQPVLELESGRVFVTSQNHGYTVAPDSLPNTAAVSYTNLSDGTCEGIDYNDIPAFSVQFTPTEDIVARFLAAMRDGRTTGDSRHTGGGMNHAAE